MHESVMQYIRNIFKINKTMSLLQPVIHTTIPFLFHYIPLNFFYMFY